MNMNKFLLLSAVAFSTLTGQSLFASNQEDLEFQRALQMSLEGVQANEDAEVQRALQMSRQTQQPENNNDDLSNQRVIAELLRVEQEEKNERALQQAIAMSSQMQPQNNDDLSSDEDFQAAFLLSLTSGNEDRVVHNQQDPNELATHLNSFSATRSAQGLAPLGIHEPTTREQEESDLIAGIGRSLLDVPAPSNTTTSVADESVQNIIRHFNGANQ